MDKIKNKVLIMSGKGGVGKTTIAVNLAYALSRMNFKVGLLDVDIHGPNVPKMLDLSQEKLTSSKDKIVPLKKDNLKVVSLGFMLNKSDSVIWRGPMKHNLIKQFINDVEWGNLDFLIIDFPPGTGDEAISVSQLLSNITGTVIVSMPQQVSLIDVERSIDFSRKVNIPIVGIIENMSGSIFGEGTVKGFAKSLNVDFLGSLGLNEKIRISGDEGKPFVIQDSDSKKSFEPIVKKIVGFCEGKK